MFQSASVSKLFDQLPAVSICIEPREGGRLDEPAHHMHILEILVVLAGFEKEDFYIRIFC